MARRSSLRRSNTKARVRRGIRYGKAAIRPPKVMRAVLNPPLPSLTKVYSVTPSNKNRQNVTPSNKKVLQEIRKELIRCKERKAYKKTMLRKVAAQMKSGGGSMKKWRDERAQKRKVVWDC